MTKIASTRESARLTWWSALMFRLVRFLAVSIASRFLFRLEVVGRERTPREGSYIVAPGAHRSNIETVIITAITTRRLRFMGKDSLWSNRLFGWFLSAMGGFPVHRAGADRQALNLAIEVVESGEPLVMFPEGTRGQGPTVGELYDGPVYVAARTQVPILPVGVGGSERAMPSGAKRIRLTKVFLVVGDPIDPLPLTDRGRVSRRAVREGTAALRETLQDLFELGLGHACREDESEPEQTCGQPARMGADRLGNRHVS